MGGSPRRDLRREERNPPMITRLVLYPKPPRVVSRRSPNALSRR